MQLPLRHFNNLEPHPLQHFTNSDPSIGDGAGFAFVGLGAVEMGEGSALVHHLVHVVEEFGEGFALGGDGH